MHDEIVVPDLTFPDLTQSKLSAPLDMKVLLYKGSSGAHYSSVAGSIDRGSFGSVLTERIELVRQVHDAVTDKLAAGGSSSTAKKQFNVIRVFFKWAEDKGYSLTVSTVQVAYIHWTDDLNHRLQVAKTLSQSTAYSQGSVVGHVLDLALGRTTPMIELTRLEERKHGKKRRSAKSDKQNLESTFAFGRLIQDICDGMTLSAVWGPRPVRILLQDGRELVLWAGKHKDRGQNNRTPPRERSRLARKAKRQAIYDINQSPKKRSLQTNFRVLAELLMFIGQTGMNLAQASCLELRCFSYASDVDGYKVRDYKSRRGGEVLFEIFKEYRSHFERYLEWRRTLFPDDLRLFPLFRFKGALESSPPHFGMIQQACKDVGVVWHPPSGLRRTRVNWMLRRSGDPDITAEMSQHRKQTLLEVYEVPSLQRAIGEITRFWQSADPALMKTAPLDAVAPGACNGVPSAIFSKPKLATSPDCTHPSGCLWCEHHRDIDSLDYVWALSSFRYLKTLEVSRYRPPLDARHSAHPGDFSISRMSEKLIWFRDSNECRRAWVEESLARIDEGSFHPEWSYLIEGIEGGAA